MSCLKAYLRRVRSNRPNQTIQIYISETEKFDSIAGIEFDYEMIEYGI